MTLCICRVSDKAMFAAVAPPAGDIDRLLHGAQRMRVVRVSVTLSAYAVADHRFVKSAQVENQPRETSTRTSKLLQQC